MEARGWRLDGRCASTFELRISSFEPRTSRTMPWDPERYEPFTALLRLVRVRPGLRAVDLGCGTGELTRRLADALPESDVLGIDSSPEMLERAAERAGHGLGFQT